MNTQTEHSTADVDHDPPDEEQRQGLMLPIGYQVMGRIGGGSMGEVYDAKHLRLGRRAAIKFLRAELRRQPRCLARFAREVRSLAAVRHPNVVDILDSGETEDGVPYFVMEYLEGQDLRAVLKAGPLDPERLRAIALDVCGGLSAVHAAGLVHRDIKPGNLFLTESVRGEERCKIVDFGVAKLGAGGGTMSGAVLGTIRYMAPEQLLDSAAVGPLSDIYSLGAVMYECLSGHPPHRAEGEQQLMLSILNHAPEPLSRLRPDLPSLAALVDRALSSDPKLRPQSCEEMANALRGAVPRDSHGRGEPSSSERKSILPATLAAFAVGISLGLAAGSANFVSFKRPANASVPAVVPPSAPPQRTVVAPIETAAFIESRLLDQPNPTTAERVPELRSKIRASAPRPAASGVLQVGAHPTWATIRLDRVSVGATPLVLKNVRAGTHTVEAISRGEGPSQRRTVELAPGATERIDFQF